MPNAIASFATWVVKAVTALGSTTTAFKVAVAAVELATYAAITFAATKLLGKDAIGTDSSRSVTTRGTVEAQKLIYGETVVSGPIAYINCGGIRNRDLYHVIALAGHECEEISDIYLGNTRVLEANINSGAAAGGAVTSGDFGPVAGNDVLAIYKYLGTSGQTANSQLVSAFTEWTSSHRGRGIAYVATVFSLWDRTDALWREHSGKNIRAKVKGKNDIYDPRLDTSAGANPSNSSYQAWSDNPALCAANYMTDTRFGMGIATSRIDWDAVVTAANVCDALVSIPGSTTEKRFTCNGVIYSNKSHKVNVKQILSSMNGTMIYAAGKYVISAGAYEAPTITLTDDDFAGDSLTIVTSASRSDRFNQIKGQFFDKADNYTPKEFPTVDPGTYVTRDNGQELPRSITLNMTDSLYMAQRIGWKLLAQQNQQMIISANFNYSALQLAVGDRVNLSVAEMGWSPKIFQVLSMKMLQGDDYAVQMELREDSSTAYADPAVSDYVQQTAEGALTENVPGVPAPSGLTATSQMNGIRLTWTLPTDDAVYDAFEVWASASSAWASAERVATTLGNTWFHPLAANTTRYYWVRAVLDGQFLSDRNPNSDTSTISATSGIDDATSGGFVNHLPGGYGDIDSLHYSGTVISSWFSNSVDTTVGTHLTFDNTRAFLGTHCLQITGNGTNGGFYTGRAATSVNGDNYHMSLPGGRRWLLSCFVYPTSYTGDWNMQLVSDSSGSSVFYNSSSDNTGSITTGQWNQVVHIVTSTQTGTGLTDTEYRLRVSSTGFGTGDGDVWLDGFMVLDITDQTNVSATSYPTNYYPNPPAPQPVDLGDSGSGGATGDLPPSRVGLGNVANERQITIFRQTNTPTALAIGDLWFDTDDGNRLYRAAATGTGSWVAVGAGTSASNISEGTLPATRGGTGITNFSDTNYRNENTTAEDVGLGNVANERQITIFRQSSTPTALTSGDLWVDTGNGNRMYRSSAPGTANWTIIGAGTSASNISAGTLPAGRGGTGLTSISTLQNTNITVNADGTLNNAGGGQVNLGGLGFTGDTNATNGAVAGTNFTSGYRPGDTEILASTASTLVNASAGWTQLADSFQLNGSGSVTVEYDRYSQASAINGHAPVQIEFRQGSTVLYTLSSIYGNSTWINNNEVNITLNNVTDPIDVFVRAQQSGQSGGVRNVSIKAGAIANGEAIV